MDIDSIESSESIFDIAPESFEAVKSILADAKLILWNGPVGMFEKQQFIQRHLLCGKNDY